MTTQSKFVNEFRLRELKQLFYFIGTDGKKFNFFLKLDDFKIDIDLMILEEEKQIKLGLKSNTCK